MLSQSKLRPSKTKPTKWLVRPVMTDQPGHAAKTDQTGWMPRLIRVFAGHTHKHCYRKDKSYIPIIYFINRGYKNVSSWPWSVHTLPGQHRPGQIKPTCKIGLFKAENSDIPVFLPHGTNARKLLRIMHRNKTFSSPSDMKNQVCIMHDHA